MTVVPAVQGLHEDTWDSLYMLRHSGQLRVVALSYVVVAGAFNLSGASRCCLRGVTRRGGGP